MDEQFGFGTVGCGYQSATQNCNRNAEPGREFCESHGCPRKGCTNQNASSDTECGKANCGAKPPAYSGSVKKGSVKGGVGGAGSKSDNNASSLDSEEIRLKDRALGYKTVLGKGELGGKTGGIEGKRSSVDQLKSAARPTLIVMQPGKPRASDSNYVPFLTPKPKAAPGHILFSMDIPPVAGKKGKQAKDTAKRIIINQNQGKGAQISIEEYTMGSKAQKGKLGPKKTIYNDDGSMVETQDWIPPTVRQAACRETIKVESFNLAEVQRCLTTQTVMSTLAEKEITIRKTRAATEVSTTYSGACCLTYCGIFKSCVNYSKPNCCGYFNDCCCPIPTEFGGERKVEKAAFCCFGVLCDCCYMWKEHNDESRGRLKENTKEADNPFDMVNVSKIRLVLRSSIMSNADDTLEYTWRVQSVGETETDLKYDMASELQGPCQDPTSAARTLANIIHYLNA